MEKSLKRILQKLIVVIVVLSTSACVIPPYYGGGVSYSYSVAPQPYYSVAPQPYYSVASQPYYSVASQPYYWGYNNQPVVFSAPYYGYGSVYDPYFSFPALGNAIIQGVGWGLGLGFMHLLFGGHHHH